MTAKYLQNTEIINYIQKNNLINITLTNETFKNQTFDKTSTYDNVNKIPFCLFSIKINLQQHELYFIN